MTSLLESLMILLALTNLALLGTTRVEGLVRLIACQGALLAFCLPLLGGHALDAHTLLFSLAVFAIKAVAFPWLLLRTLRRISAKAWIEPYLGYNLSLLCGVGGLVFSLWLETKLPVPAGLYPSLVLPLSLATIFSGLTLVVTRKKAISQVIGYLAAENGIFLLGAPLSGQSSAMLELCVLLDVFVGVFVMGIAIHHIHATFESIDVGRFCTLRD